MGWQFKLRSNRRKFGALLVSFSLFFLVVILFNAVTEGEDATPICFAINRQNCGKGEDGKRDILPEFLPPTGGSDFIMFIEGYGNHYLTPRMLCAVESAAFLHTNVTVFVLMTSSQLKLTPVTNDVLVRNSNVKVAHLNVTTLFSDSPLAEWFKLRNWERSHWPKSHFNDVLRWLVLWKYGGIYLDMDVVIVRPLIGRITKSFSALESTTNVAVGAMGFRKRHHYIIDSCLESIKNYFDVSEWGSVGPKLLTKILKGRCGMKLPSGDCKRCPDFEVFSKETFYPIPWWDWHEYLNDKESKYDSVLNNPQTMAIHVWNAFTKSYPIDLQKKNIYAIVANKFCPTVTLKLQTVF